MSTNIGTEKDLKNLSPAKEVQPLWHRYIRLFFIYSLLIMGVGAVFWLMRSVKEKEEESSALDFGDMMENVVTGGSEFQVNTYTTNNQLNPTTARLTNGDFVVVWTSDWDGSYQGVYGQRYNSTGIKQGDEFRVNSYTTNEQQFPAIAGLATGDFVVVWTSFPPRWLGVWHLWSAL
jgi:hypothetical protein